MGPLIGHCHLEGHLFKVELIKGPEGDLKWPLFCDIQAMATLRFRHLGQNFMKPGDLRTSPLTGYCTLFKVQACCKREHYRLHKRSVTVKVHRVIVVPALLYSIL
jgi:hypothetical protein